MRPPVAEENLELPKFGRFRGARKLETASDRHDVAVDAEVSLVIALAQRRKSRRLSPAPSASRVHLNANMTREEPYAK